MTASEALLTLIGRRATLATHDYNSPLTIDVIIRDAKNAYGNDRVLVEPVAGTGQTWVNITRITLEKES